MSEDFSQSDQGVPEHQTVESTPPPIDGDQSEKQQISPGFTETTELQEYNDRSLVTANPDYNVLAINEAIDSPEKQAEKLAVHIAESSEQGRQLRWEARQIAQRNPNDRYSISEQALYESPWFSNIDSVEVVGVKSIAFETPEQHTGYSSFRGHEYEDPKVTRTVAGLSIDVHCSVESDYKNRTERKLVYDLEHAPVNEHGKTVRVSTYPPRDSLYGRYEVLVRDGVLVSAFYQPVKRGEYRELVPTGEPQEVDFSQTDEQSEELLRLMKLHHEGQKQLLAAFGDDVASENWSRVVHGTQYTKVRDQLRGRHWTHPGPSTLLGGEVAEAQAA